MRLPLRLRTVLLASAIPLALGGCAHYAHYEPRPLAPADSAAAFDARSLASPDLRRFLEESLHRDFSAWPRAEWDFEALSWVAFYYNPSLEVARSQWAEARGGVTAAGARANPTVSLVPGYNTNNPTGVSPWLPAISFDIPLSTAGKRGQQVDLATFSAEAARQAVFAEAWRVRAELRAALIDLDAAGRRSAALRSQADVQRRVLSLLEERRAAGAGYAAESSAARIMLARSQAAVADADQLLPLARSRAAQALGLPVSALAGIRLDLPASVSLSADELAAARRRSLQGRADVLGALAGYEASQHALALEIAKQHPDLHLGPGYQYDQGLDKWTLALTLELPIFNHNEGPVAQAEARRGEAAASFTAIQAAAIAEIDGVAAALAAADGQVRSLEAIQEELARQDARIRVRLAAGGADSLEVETSALDVAAGQIALLDARAQAARASGQLEDALQVPLSNFEALAPASGGASAQSPP